MPENELERMNPPVKQKRSFWGHLGILISGLAASILIAGVLAANYVLLTINRGVVNALNEVKQQVNDAEAVVTETQKNAVNAEQNMQQSLKAQTQMIADIQKNQQTNKDDFLQGEAYYLLNLAQDSLQYERNTVLAIKLLQSADKDIAKMSDSKAYPIRQAIAADIVALQSVPQVDITGIYVKLAALNEQIDKLPLIPQLNHAATKPSEVNPTLPWWRRGLDSLQQALQRIVIIRKISSNLPPFVAPDQQVFLYQNLHAEIEKAQWALLHHQPEIYRLSLTQTEQWIKQYADQDSAITKQLLQSLTELQQIDIYPATPDVNSSLQALQNVGK